MATTFDGQGFPPTAPNAQDLPCAIKAEGWELASSILVYGGFLLVSLTAVAATYKNLNGAQIPQLLFDLGWLAAAAFCGWRLWLLRTPYVVFQPDRIERRGLFGWRSLSRSEFLGVGRTITGRYGSYFLIYPKAEAGIPIQLNGKLRDNRVVAAWLAGASDPVAEAVQTDRAAVLADPRYGASETERAARLDLAKKAMIAFNVACLAAAAWFGFFSRLDATAVGLASLELVAGAAIVAASNGLIVWIPARKARPSVIGAFAPIAGLSLHAALTVHIFHNQPLIWSAVVAGVAAAGLLVLRPVIALGGVRGAASIGIGVAFAAYGALALADVAFDNAPHMTFLASVQGKHVSNGRSTTYYLDLGPWGWRDARSVSVNANFYDQIEIGKGVCVTDHPGALRLGWFEVDYCPLGVQPPSTAALQAETPETSQEFVNRGVIFLDRGAYEAAIRDFDQAIRRDPKNAWAHVDRGIAHAESRDTVKAVQDFDAADRLQPHYFMAFRGRGISAELQGRRAEAIGDYTKALSYEPNDLYSLARRAGLFLGSGRIDEALADTQASIKIDRRQVDPYMMAANIFYSRGDQQQALQEADAVIDANPGNTDALVAGGRIYAALDHQSEALRAFDQALQIKPDGAVYINRAQVRPKSDFSRREADLDAALKLDPKSEPALGAKAALQRDRGDLPGAIATWTVAQRLHPTNPNLLVLRGIDYIRAGRKDLAEADFAAARAQNEPPAVLPLFLNNACWNKATAGVALDSALADCGAALAIDPDNPAFLDSRGLVLLRLGRLGEALVEYNRALALKPTQANSLYARAVIEARTGKKVDSDRDLARAVAFNPRIAEIFSDYGVTPAPAQPDRQNTPPAPPLSATPH